jgi:hypothetical protein
MATNARNFGRKYDTAELRSIRASKYTALQAIIKNAYIRVFGLSFDDPSELWEFALSNSEMFSDSAAYREFRQSLKQRGLRETVLSLAKRFEDEVALRKHIETLLRLSNLLPAAKTTWANSRRDSDRATQMLVEFWIDDGIGKNSARSNFCFFSDLAMAKLVYFRTHQRRLLPANLLTKEPERIRKLYRSLGLIPARRRLIKDIEFKAGKIHHIPFKNTLGFVV